MTIFGMAGRAAAAAFRLIPYGRRYGVAMALACAIRPIVRRTRVYAERRSFSFDDIRETSLDLVLAALTRQGVDFRPDLRVEGAHLLDDDGSGRPILMISAHTMLSVMVVRHLYDRGISGWIAVSAEPDQRIPGTRVPMHRIPAPSPTLLLNARKHLRDGRMVIAMVDRHSLETDRRNQIVDVHGGPITVSGALLRIARRCGARVLFLAGFMDGDDQISLRFVAAPDNEEVLTTIERFGAFVGDVRAQT